VCRVVSVYPRYDPIVGFLEHGVELLGLVEGGEFFNLLNKI
jgi:hypothetical protein